METLATLFAEHAAVSLDKQQSLSERIGDHDWSLDIDAGSITFNDKLTYPVQILGTESDASGTWLWAWANTVSEFPDGLLKCARQLKALGEKSDIVEFKEAEIGLADVSGHYISMIAAGVCGADCYYRGPYEGGAVYLTLDAPELKQYAGTAPAHLMNIMNQLIGTFDVDHRATLIAYLEYKGYSYTGRGTTIEAFSPAGDRLVAKFDAQGRIDHLGA